MTSDQVAALVVRLQDARNRLRVGLPIAEDLYALLDDSAEALCEAEEAMNFMELVEHGGAFDSSAGAANDTPERGA